MLWCSEYKDLREGENLKDNKDIAEYIQKVVKLRERKEESTQKPCRNSDKTDNTSLLAN